MFHNLLSRIQVAVSAGYQKLKDNSGNATVELALTFSVLVAPLMLGTAETHSSSTIQLKCRMLRMPERCTG